MAIIGAILIFSVIIFVHELGHFIAARITGVNVLEFAIGMGPAIFKKQGKDTLYSIRIVPMGGFCKMEGEDEDLKTEGSFNAKKPLPKIFVLVSGAAMNIILGFVIATSLVLTSAMGVGGLPSTVVAEVNPDASAAEFLRAGDKIIAVNGKRVHIQRDISFALSNAETDSYSVTYLRDGQKYTDTFTPYEMQYEDGTTGKFIGFSIAPQKITPWGVIREGFYQTVWMAKLVFVSIGMLFSGEAGVSEMSGPVGVVHAMNTVAQSGLLNFIFFAGFLTVNIGIMNLLPLPALDGGRIIFSLFELIFKKPVPPDKEGFVHMIGFALLIGLMIFATWNDIARLIGGV